MNTYTDNRLITLNSRNATKNNGSFKSDVLFNLTGVLKEEHDIINTQIELVNAQIPVSFYSVNYTNNILTYTLGTTKTITLMRGNYSSTQFMNALKSGFLANGDTFTITISTINGILTFTNATNYTFVYATSTIMGVLGFSSDATSTGGVLVAPYPLNLASITSLSIMSNTLATYNYSSNNNLTSSLITLNVDKPTWGIITFQSQSSQSRLLRYKIINSIDIQIQDQNGYLINFNNLDWNLTFSIQIMRFLPLINKLDFLKVLNNENEKLGNTLGINKRSPIPNKHEGVDDDLDILEST